MYLSRHSIIGQKNDVIDKVVIHSIVMDDGYQLENAHVVAGMCVLASPIAKKFRELCFEFRFQKEQIERVGKGREQVLCLCFVQPGFAIKKRARGNEK